jgi:hypothetical protein
MSTFLAEIVQCAQKSEEDPSTEKKMFSFEIGQQVYIELKSRMYA